MDIPYRRAASWKHRILLSADRHLDSPHSRLDLQKRHLEEMAQSGALMMDFGDLFDAMQGRDDPRRSKSALAHLKLDAPYWDGLVDMAYELLAPYQQHIILLGKGNHEARVVERAETDLIKRLCERLGVIAGGYRGFVELRYFLPGKTSSRFSYTLYYTHGSGGGGEVTRGVIRTNRRAVYLPDADVIVSGHVHESWLVEVPRVRLVGGVVRHLSQYHVQLPSYKVEFLQSDWWDMKDYAPKTVGAWWLEAYWDTTDERVKLRFYRAD